MIKSLYKIFQHWSKNGSVYLYSDPHFGDWESYTFRGLTTDKTKEELDQFQVNNINKVVHKSDTIIFLGDIGDPTLIKKINGYKVLIMGNHDKGVSNYKRVERFEKIDVSKYLDGKTPNELCIELSDKEREQYYEEARKKAEREYKAKPDFIRISNRINYGFHSPFMSWYAYFDNHLFDEVYEGPLMITDKVLLSHEPIENCPPFLFNIHGHDHSGTDFKTYVLKDYDADMSCSEMAKNYLTCVKNYKLNKLNLCAEWINYTPISLDQIIKSGVLTNIPTIHRDYLDKK